MTAVVGSVDWHIDNKLVHSIHNSGAKSFQSCRRRWSWIYHDKFYPTVTAKPLEFGVAFHAAMEKLYDPMTWHDKEVALSLALGTFTQTVDKQYLDFRKKNPSLMNDEVSADYKERKELGLTMLRYYGKHVMPKADMNLTPIKVEVEFEVAIKGPSGETLWCKCDTCWTKWKAYVIEKQDGKFINEANAEVVLNTENLLKGWATHGGIFWSRWKGLPVTFGGRIDCLMQDDLGRYWIYDWKTAARLSASEDYLYLDTQITSYCWALWSIGVPIAGFIYAELKKATPVEPEPNKTVRLGRLYSVNRQIDTTAEMYENTVRENDNLAYTQGLYDDFIAYLKGPNGPKYHQRFQIHRNHNELRNAGLTIFDIAKDMVDPNISIYPAPGKFNCQSCAFSEPCLGMNRGEDYMYTLHTMFEKRERHYYETEKSTDSRGGE